LNKTTIATLNSDDLENVNGGFRTTIQIITDDECAYTEGCTGWGCYNSQYGLNTCIYTNYGDMAGCPLTMTLCGQLYCP